MLQVPSFRIWQAKPSPLILSVPHAGRLYGLEPAQTPNGGRAALEVGEDRFVDLLALAAVREGASLIAQRIPRGIVDLNRAPDEMQPDFVKGGYWQPTYKAKAGLGVVPTCLRQGEPLYDHPLTAQEVQRRIDAYYHPYHETLEQLIHEARIHFPQVLVVDLHSMPPLQPKSWLQPAPRIVIGDKFGTSAEPKFSEHVLRFMRGKGLRSSMNYPFSGGHLTQRHSNPVKGVSVLQIELCRSLYLQSPDYRRKSARFVEVRRLISQLSRQLLDELLS